MQILSTNEYLLSFVLDALRYILSISRCSDDEWRVKVAIDDQVGQSIIFADLVLLSIYLPS